MAELKRNSQGRNKMKDRILEGYIDDFANQHGLGDLDQGKLFSYFVNFAVISRTTPDTLSLENFDVDGSDDLGIDGLAIIINGHPVTTPEETDHFLNTFRRLDVEFHFIQSKSATSFDTAEIGNFFFGVRDFFSDAPSSPINEDIKDYFELKEHIYSLSIHMEASPTCYVYYATTGLWDKPVHPVARAESQVGALKDTNLFNKVEFQPIDAGWLKNTYRALRQKIVREINFDKHTILPRIEGVTEAYLGIVPCSEFLRLLCDDDGEILRFLFYDNVRDYQGNSSVNREIAATLRNAGLNDKLVLLNNGITVVAKSIHKVGSSFKISDYQIVNGCQTCHELHRSRHLLSESAFLPLKLVVTEDAETTNLVIKATNRQTEVKLEAFESLGPFHRTLEDYYNVASRSKDRRLFYERRSKQYAGLPVKPHEIVTLATQAQAFLSMFLEEPHSTHRYYGEILRTNRDRMFINGHSPMPYFCSALALTIVRELMRKNSLPREAKRFTHHIVLVFRIAASGKKFPDLRSRKIEPYCQKMIDVLLDPGKARIELERAANIVLQALTKFDGERRLAPHLRNFTTHLEPSVKQRLSGRVIFYNIERGFGFIELPNERDVFVHVSNLKDTTQGFLSTNDYIQFDIRETNKGPEAIDVTLLSSER